jgi:hypothetical protein
VNKADVFNISTWGCAGVQMKRHKCADVQISDVQMKRHKCAGVQISNMQMKRQ